MKPSMNSLAYERVSAKLAYEPKSGKLIWKVNSGKAKAGYEAGFIRKNGRKSEVGYRYVTVNGVKVAAHRVAWLLATGSMPNGEIDHINEIKSDNRIENLRDVDSLVNRHNQAKPTNRNKLQLRGVSRERSGRFCARIMVNGKVVYLGSFSSPDQARAAYIAAQKSMPPAGPDQAP